MRCGSNTRSWLGLLLTLFMVLVLPSCWYGTLQRAIVTSDIPANGQEEEREDHDQEQHSKEELARRTAPPPIPVQPVVVRERPALVLAPVSSRIASVAPPVHPSLFSVKRQQ